MLERNSRSKCLPTWHGSRWTLHYPAKSLREPVLWPPGSCRHRWRAVTEWSSHVTQQQTGLPLFLKNFTTHTMSSFAPKKFRFHNSNKELLKKINSIFTYNFRSVSRCCQMFQFSKYSNRPVFIIRLKIVNEATQPKCSHMSALHRSYHRLMCSALLKRCYISYLVSSRINTDGLFSQCGDSQSQIRALASTAIGLWHSLK